MMLSQQLTTIHPLQYFYSALTDNDVDKNHAVAVADDAGDDNCCFLRCSHCAGLKITTGRMLSYSTVVPV